MLYFRLILDFNCHVNVYRNQKLLTVPLLVTFNLTENTFIIKFNKKKLHIHIYKMNRILFGKLLTFDFIINKKFHQIKCKTLTEKVSFKRLFRANKQKPQNMISQKEM